MYAQAQFDLSDSAFKIIFILNFIIRLHYCFPKNGFDTWTFSDFKLDAIQQILQFIYVQESLALNTFLIITLLLGIRLTLYGAIVMYYFNNISYYVFFIPIIAVFAQMEHIYLSIIGIVILITWTLFNQYFNRYIKFLHNNPFMRKYSVIVHVQLCFDVLMVADFDAIQVFVLYMTSLIRVLDLILYLPYRNGLNQFVFQLEIGYLTTVIVVTVSLIIDIQDNLIFLICIVSAFSIQLAQILYQFIESFDIQNQYLILSQCQGIYLGHELIRYQYSKIHQCPDHESHDDLIQCMMTTAIRINKFKRNQVELLQLASINFLTYYKPCLQAYCSLKSYMNEEQSYFFRLASAIIDQQIWIRVKGEQHVNERISQESKEIRTKDIYKAQKCRDAFFPLTLQIIEQKLQFWNSMHHFIQKMQMIFKYNIQLSAKIHEYQSQINEIFEQQTPKTIIEIKLMEIYYAIVINDQVQSQKYQTKLNEILRLENQQQIGKILNQAIYNNCIHLVQASMVAKKGYIIKQKSNSMALFWGYENITDFREVLHINQLMPEYIAQHHDQLINEFLLRGTSKIISKSRQIFIKEREEFLIAADLRFDNFKCIQNDYILTAVFVKVKEKALFIQFDEKGLILGINRQVLNLFNMVDANCQLHDILDAPIYLLIPSIFYLINDTAREHEYDSIIMYIGYNIRKQLGTNMFQSRTIKQSSKSRQTYNWSTYVDKSSLAEIQDENYQQSMMNQVDLSIPSVQYSMRPNLILEKINGMKLFTLEINDVVEQSRFQQEKVEVTSIKNSISDVELSSIQDERMDQIYKEPDTTTFKLFQAELTRNIQQANNDESNLLDLKQEESYRIKDPNDSARQLVAPQSQRAVFHNFKQKTLEDDSRILEQDLAKIRQQIYEENKSSSDKKYELNISKNKDIKTIESLDSHLTNQNTQIVKSICYSKRNVFPVTLIIILSILSVLVNIVFLTVNIVLIDTDSQNNEANVQTIQAPYKYNNHLCMMITYNMIYNINKARFISSSANLITSLENYFRNNTLLQEMAQQYSIFIDLQSKGYFSNQPIIFIQQASVLKYDFTTVYSIFSQQYQNLINLQQNYTQYTVNENALIQSFFLNDNIQTFSKLYTSLINSIISKNKSEMVSQNNATIPILIVEIFISLILYLCLMNSYLRLYAYYKKFLLLTTRIYEKDIHNNTYRLRVALHALTGSQGNWKRIDYVELAQMRMMQSNKSTHTKNTQDSILSSRIQNHQLIEYLPIGIYILLELIIVGILIGSYELTQTNVTQYAPTNDLTNDFLQYAVMVDSVVAFGINVKFQNSFQKSNVLQFINISKENVAYNLQNNDQVAYQYFADTFDLLEDSMLKIISSTQANQYFTSQMKQQLNNLFSQDLCSYMCTNLSGIDNNTEYASKGLIGIQSQLYQFIVSNFHQELTNLSADPNISNILQVLKSQQFNIIFYRHFLNTQRVFQIVITLMIQNSSEQINSNKVSQILYQFLSRFGLLIIQVIMFAYLIHRERKQLKFVRLSLLNLQDLDLQSLSILRQLQ